MRRIPTIVLLPLVLSATLGACGGDEAIPFTLTLSPEFVQGAIPGANTGVLVTIENESATEAPVTIAATAVGAEVTVEPSTIAAGEVAEVWVIAGPTAADAEMEIVVTGSRGGFEASASKTLTLFAWEDDRGPYARTLFDLFTAWLAENRPDLGISPDTAFAGSFTAPGLLVVSHYLFLSDDWEIGLSWHVMIPPDDWAEIYLRPRDGTAPTVGFRLSSQAGALEGGVVEITEVTPPVEVVR
ncbi:MAG: hypothetical protein V1757_10570 [Actinomycetota bacterium]